MLKLTAFEFIFRTLPEAFIFIFASFALANQKIDIKKFILSSILVAISIFLIRMLPINYGVHTILNIITQTVILNSMNKFDIIPAVKSALVTTICLFIIELLNMVALNIIYRNQLNVILSNPIMKTIYGLPSLVVFLIIIICYYYFIKGKNEYVKN